MSEQNLPKRRNRVGLSSADLTAARERDPGAMTRIYVAYAPALFRFFVAAVGDRHTAEDLTSTVFTTAIEGLPEFRGPVEALGGWLFQIARHDLFNYRRLEARSSVDRLEDVLNEAALAGGVEDPEELAIQRLETTRVMAGLEQLPPDQREVLLLRMAGGLTVPEVATILGKTTGAVRALQHRGLARLARALGLRDRETVESTSASAGVKRAFDALPVDPGDPGPTVAEFLKTGLESDNERSVQTDDLVDQSSETGVLSEQTTLHFYGEIEPTIMVNGVSTVIVTVSRRQPISAEDEGEDVVNWSLILEAIGIRNVEVAGRSRLETTIPTSDDPKLLLFDVRGTHVGDGEVWIVGRQGQIPLVTLALKPGIVENRTEPELAQRATK